MRIDICRKGKEADGVVCFDVIGMEDTGILYKIRWDGFGVKCVEDENIGTTWLRSLSNTYLMLKVCFGE